MKDKWLRENLGANKMKYVHFKTDTLFLSRFCLPETKLLKDEVSEYTSKLSEEITRLNDKLFRLEHYLGVEFMHSDVSFPKYIKIKKGGKDGK